MSSFTESLNGLVTNVHAALGNLKGRVDVASVAVERSMDSPDVIYVGDVVDFIIANYDSETEYAAVTTHGSVEIVTIEQTVNGRLVAYRKAVRFTAPTDYSGTVTITVNSRSIDVTVEAKRIAKPTIASLTDGQTDVAVGYNITSSAFVSKPDGEFVHDHTDWQIATDSSFVNLVVDTVASTTDLESMAVPDTLDTGTTYYVRVRHGQTGGVYSEWSDGVSFVTAQLLVQGNEIQIVTPTTALGSGDMYGFAMAYDGTSLAITAPSSELAMNNGGAVYVMEKSGGLFVETAVALPSAIAYGNSFGRSVAISGDVLCVGSPGTHETHNGRLHVYSRQPDNSWLETQTITNNTASLGFGSSVALSPNGRWMVVGAMYSGVITTRSGGIVIYENVAGTWTERAVLGSSQSRAYGQLGASVVMSDTAIFAGTLPDTGSAWQGHVQRFDFDGTIWSATTFITATDGHRYDQFGKELALDGDVLYVGAPFNNTLGTEAGAVYVFNEALGVTPTQTDKKLWNGTGAAYNRHGNAIAVDGDTLLIASPGYSSARGEVEVHYKQPDGTFAFNQTIRVSNSAGSDWFAADLVLVDGDMVGSSSTKNNNTGAVYYYK